MIEIKKNSFLKIACLMLVVIMLATSIISGTLAKYYSEGNVSAGNLALTIAKWNVQVEDQTLGDSEFSVEISNLEWEIANIEEEVTTAATPYAAAPGTWGFAQIVTIENQSDVDAIVKINFDDFSLPDATKYGKYGMEFKIVAMPHIESIDDMSGYEDMTNDDVVDLKNDGVRIAINDSITIYVCYTWEFDGDTKNNVDDTDIAGESIEFGGTITITAEQAN